MSPNNHFLKQFFIKLVKLGLNLVIWLGKIVKFGQKGQKYTLGYGATAKIRPLVMEMWPKIDPWLWNLGSKRDPCGRHNPSEVHKTSPPPSGRREQERVRMNKYMDWKALVDGQCVSDGFKVVSWWQTVIHVYYQIDVQWTSGSRVQQQHWAHQRMDSRSMGAQVENCNSSASTSITWPMYWL